MRKLKRNPFKLPGWTLAVAALCSLVHFQAPLAAQTDSGLVSNGGFELDDDSDGWPDHWAKPAGATWETAEEGGKYLRMTQPEPGKTTLLYRDIKIPEGTKALQLSFRARVSELTRGPKSWFDARIMMDFKDAEGKKLKAPKAPNFGKNTEGWVEKTSQFLVPEGAVQLDLMPTLFQVQAGVFELDDITLTAVDPAALEAEMQAKRDETLAKAQARQTEVVFDEATGININGQFNELDNKGNVQGWPGAKSGISYENEDGLTFARLESTEPGKMVSLYREITVPQGVDAMELKFRGRTSNLKLGKEAWFDARIMMNFKDAFGKKLKSPGAPNFRKNTDGWVEKSTKFLVPEGAVVLEFIPALMNVVSGTFDITDITLKPTDAVAMKAEAEAKAKADAKAALVVSEPADKSKWPPEIKVVGNQLQTMDGKHVWLQGVNIMSLDWGPKGENVLAASKEALENWNSNVLRLAVKEVYWFGRDSSQKDGGEAYRSLVDAVINLAANRGSYVLLDLHRYRAPKEEHVEFWKDAAARYKNHPAVLFDILNEPHGISWEVWRNGGFVEEKKKKTDEDTFLSAEDRAKNREGFQSPGMQGLVEAVRSTGAKNVIAAGGLDYAYDLSGIVNGYALEDKTGNGIMYSTHIYNWKKNWQDKVLATAEKYPIIVGECGANVGGLSFIPAKDQEDPYVWCPEFIGLVQKYKLNWTAFSFHPKASPVLLKNWEYEPTPEWGVFVKQALVEGKQFEVTRLR